MSLLQKIISNSETDIDFNFTTLLKSNLCMQSMNELYIMVQVHCRNKCFELLFCISSFENLIICKIDGTWECELKAL